MIDIKFLRENPDAVKENIKKNSNKIELLRKSLERDNSKKEQEANNIISNAKIKARNILLDAKDEANEIIKELNSMTEKDNLANANEARNKLNSSINKLSIRKTRHKKEFVSRRNTNRNGSFLYKIQL